MFSSAIDKFKLMNLSEQKRAVREYGFFWRSTEWRESGCIFLLLMIFMLNFFIGYYMWVAAG